MKCTQCHDPHGGTGTKSLLRAKVEDGLCFGCHERGDLLGGKKIHGDSLFGGNCLICHDPHSSEHPKLLHRSEFALCSTCHPEMARPEDPEFRWHQAALESCAGCHDPHSSDLPKHLKATLPELCLGCHEEQVRELGAAHVHAALQDQSGEPTQCLSCHDPHASRHEHLLEVPQLDSCLGCHDQPIEVAGRAAIPSVKTQIETRKHLHGPLAEGNCVTCHQPHASEHPRLLKGEFPAEFYAPFSEERYALCFQCHEDVVALATETPDTTRFRDGTRNLHALHVRSDEKGRSCRACHEAHASNLPFLLRETVLFGEWEMPIGFEPLPGGGACTPGCHAHLEYHRDAK